MLTLCPGETADVPCPAPVHGSTSSKLGSSSGKSVDGGPLAKSSGGIGEREEEGMIVREDERGIVGEVFRGIGIHDIMMERQGGGWRMPKKSPKQLFHKLFYRYTVLIVCIVLALAVYFISAMRNRILETNRHYMDMMTEEAASYVDECSQTAGHIQAELYQSSGILNDLLTYFQYEPEEYQKYRLDTFIASSSAAYEGFNNFMEKVMENNSDIRSIEIIAYDKSEVTTCYPDGKTYIRQNAKLRMAEVERRDLARDGTFSFVKEIRDPDTLTGAGCMIVNFKADQFRKIQEYYSIAGLLVCSQNHMVIFQSDNELDANAFFQTQEGEIARDTSQYYVQKSDIGDYSIYGMADKKKAAQVPFTTILAVLGVGLGVILLGEWCVRIYLLHLTGRLNHIIDGMQRVTTGDLSMRLAADENGDELDVISTQFNEMCQELDRYIQKSYLAEIEQKNAEMEALQSQINPHFLYNTLEAIRMKAICNGDRDVGKMLYSMSVIFRSQLKDSDIITLIQEMHYCKKYLELFEYRYQGKFTSKVECPEELMNYPVMKFILQPIVENYFVHGIRSEQEGNTIHIWAKRIEDALFVHIEDNGKGMTEEEIEAKNAELGAAEHHKKSVGISNVNTRIRAVYGDGYGVILKSREGGGLHVIVKIGIDKKDEVREICHEESDVSRG
ncbi:MAG: sensor histidine kinase [Faecalicatena sp.]|uniref:sensor histidine kinase n=1 Tax=Faecalicatena sp. TaxID=2005360 RepID=UPI00258F68DC|nr:sensor histidine kinase [Faecalicatena sp.]MCI6467696.1 sensor histidine kinase [Faecalicatena sp.]MDY5616947.1 sensor histidine kinase [Lachnospiraceae bacterium]